MSQRREFHHEQCFGGTSPTAFKTRDGRLFFPTRNGLGMGLSICRRIIENHHGQIEARNHGDGGASFTFRLLVRAGTTA